MSEPKPAEPDGELLEFLGSIDEVNDDSQEDVSDVLATTDIDKVAEQKPNAPGKEDKSD